MIKTDKTIIITRSVLIIIVTKKKEGEFLDIINLKNALISMKAEEAESVHMETTAIRPITELKSFITQINTRQNFVQLI